MAKLPETQRVALAAAAVAPLTRRRHGWANEGHRGFATNTIMSLGAKGLLDVVEPYKSGTATITAAGMTLIDEAAADPINLQGSGPAPITAREG